MTSTQNWQRFLNAHRGTDDGSSIARRIGASPASVSRWVNGIALPRPQQATEFAKVYGANPLAALIASGYITAADINLAEAAAGAAPDLGNVTTAQLLHELQTRLDELQELFSTRDGNDLNPSDIIKALQQRHMPPANVVRLDDHRDTDTLTGDEAARLLRLPHAALERDNRDPEAESDITP